MNESSLYLPQDRRRALARGETLPDRAAGSALLVDISGFTPLAAALLEALGPRRGAEELSGQLNRIYTALIGEVERWGGSVISFAGDALTCWFDETGAHLPAARRAVACAQALQTVIQPFARFRPAAGGPLAIAIKTAVASGPARRFVVGEPAIQQLDILAGNTLNRMASGEQLACKGEVIVDEATLAEVGAVVAVRAWRQAASAEDCAASAGRYAGVDAASAERYAGGGAGAAERYALIDCPAGLEPAPEWRQAAAASLPDAEARPWLLAWVYEQIQARTGEFLAELRPVAALFLRFTGLDYDGDEQAGEKLNTLVVQVQTIVNRFEGTLLQLTIGDKGSFLYAVFGAPLAHEDDPRRAVSAGLELQQALAQVGFVVSVQIGISQGVMWVGSYGGSTRRTYGALGDEANLAARLMQAAGAGEILVSSRAYYACRAAFQWEARPAITVKGKTGPIPIFVPLQAAHEQALRLFEPVYSAAMVGRRAELGTAIQKMELVLQGQGQVVGIYGEAGLGKSRLMAEVIRAARGRGFVVHGGACQPEATNTPYQVWKTIWRSFFGVGPGGPPGEQIQRLAAQVSRLAPERKDLLPLLEILVGLPLPENSFTRGLDPKLRQSALHALLEDCLKGAARQAPRLLVLEDLHEIDALSHDLLEDLARVIARQPVLIALAYRPANRARLQAPRVESLAHFTRLDLHELSAAEGAQMIADRLAQLYPGRRTAPAAGLVEQLMLRGQGNPFYIEELLNYLHAGGVDLFAAQDPARLFAGLPDSLHALILSRLDQLSERQKLTLKVASIIGRGFRLAWLAGYYPALGDSELITGDLEALRRQDILLLDTPLPDLAYLFKHVVTQDVIYDSLPYATRAWLHEAFAAYLEIASPAELPLDQLAYHYERSENIPKRIHYLRQAGEAAQAAYANAAAIEYYARLLPLLAGEPEAGIQVHLRLGSVTELLGEWEEALGHYTNGLELAERAARRNAAAGCQLALGKLQSRRGSYEAARQWLEQARAGFERQGDLHGLSVALAELGMVFHRLADYGAANDLIEESLTILRRLASNPAGDEPWPNAVLADQAMALKNLGNVAWRQGRYPRAHACYTESLALYRQVEDKQGVAALLNNLGNVLDDEGDYEGAWARYEESLALCRAIGDKKGISRALSNLGFMAWSQDDLPTARALHQEALGMEQELGEKWGTAMSLNNLGSVAAEQGDYPAAREYFEQGMALSQEIGTLQDVALGWCNLGEVAAAEGDYRTAGEFYQKSVRLAQEKSFSRLAAYNLILLAEVALHDPAPEAGEAAARRAARLLAAGSTVLEGLGARLNRVEQRAYDRALAGVEAALGAAGMAAAWAEGARLTLDETVSENLVTENPGL